jgi:hypothetical protein
MRRDPSEMRNLYSARDMSPAQKMILKLVLNNIFHQNLNNVVVKKILLFRKTSIVSFKVNVKIKILIEIFKKKQFVPPVTIGVYKNNGNNQN